MQDIIELFKELSIKAGKEILRVYEKDFDVSYKEDNSPLTEADKLSNEIIVCALKQKYPQYAILAEESTDDLSRLKNDWCFIIDLLDGTKEFVKKNGEFTINIALAYRGKAIAGLIYIPVWGEMYYASLNEGAFYKKGELIKRIHVSDKTTEITMLSSRSHANDKLNQLIESNKSKIKNIKSVGSSIKGCLIAKGEAEVYYRYGYTMELDTAAMQIIVEEAGGVFLQMDKTPMTYNRENPLNEKGFFILNNIKNML